MDIAEECGTVVLDDGVGIVVIKLDDVLIAPGSVPPMPGTPAKPPVNPPGPPAAPLGRKKRFKSEEESSEEDIWLVGLFFLWLFFLRTESQPLLDDLLSTSSLDLSSRFFFSQVLPLSLKKITSRLPLTVFSPRRRKIRKAFSTLQTSARPPSPPSTLRTMRTRRRQRRRAGPASTREESS